MNSGSNSKIFLSHPLFILFAFSPVLLPLLLRPSAAVAQTHTESSSKAAEQSPFGSTWKLLNGQQKLNFVAGYLHGLRDAAYINDIAANYVRSNPGQAADALDRLRPLYDLATVSPEQVVRELDRFYSDPASISAPLTTAMSDARSSIFSARR